MDYKEWFIKYKGKYDLEELKELSREFNFNNLEELKTYKSTLEQDKAKLESAVYKIEQLSKSAEHDYLDCLKDFQNFTSTTSSNRDEMNKIDLNTLYSKVYGGNLESYCYSNGIDINKINELEYVRMLKEKNSAGYNAYYKDSDIDLLLQLNDETMIKKYNYYF